MERVGIVIVLVFVLNRSVYLDHSSVLPHSSIAHTIDMWTQSVTQTQIVIPSRHRFVGI